MDRKSFIATLGSGTLLTLAGYTAANAGEIPALTPINVIIPRDYQPPVGNNSEAYQKKLVRATLDVLETHYSDHPVPVWEKPFATIDFEKRLTNIVYWLMVGIRQQMKVYPLDPAWLIAQMMKESFFYEFAVSRALAVGICQFIQPTAISYDMLCAGSKEAHAQAPHLLPELAGSADLYYQIRTERRRYRRGQKPGKMFDLEEALQTIAFGSGSSDQAAAQKQLDYINKNTEFDLAVDEARDNYRKYLQENVAGRDIFSPADLEFLVGFDERFTYKKPIISMAKMMASAVRARGGNILAATIGYNAGLSSTIGTGRYKRFGRIPAIEQSTNYISHILINHYEILEKLG